MWSMNKTFVIIVACILLIVACVGVLIALSKSFKTEANVATSSFYIAIDDMRVESSDVFEINFDDHLAFKVYSDDSEVSYTVSVKQADNIDCQFYYLVDSDKKTYSFSDINCDFTSGFEIVKTDDGFKLNPACGSFEEILETSLDQDSIVITHCDYSEPIFKVLVEDSMGNICTFNLKMSIFISLVPKGVTF